MILCVALLFITDVAATGAGVPMVLSWLSVGTHDDTRVIRTEDGRAEYVRVCECGVLLLAGGLSRPVALSRFVVICKLFVCVLVSFVYLHAIFFFINL